MGDHLPRFRYLNEWNLQSFWMICGYLHFRKPSYKEKSHTSHCLKFRPCYDFRKCSTCCSNSMPTVILTKAVHIWELITPTWCIWPRTWTLHVGDLGMWMCCKMFPLEQPQHSKVGSPAILEETLLISSRKHVSTLFGPMIQTLGPPLTIGKPPTGSGHRRGTCCIPWQYVRFTVLSPLG